MAKRSRRAVRSEPPGDHSSSSAERVTTTPAGSRTTRRSRPHHTAQPTTLERFRAPLMAALVVGGLLVIGYFFFFGQGSNANAAYTCLTQLTPAPAETLNPTPTVAATPTSAPTPSETSSVAPSASPTASPSPTPQPTPRLGFTTPILGRDHVATNSTITYGFCPPTSGNHYNQAGFGPIAADVYGAQKEQAPGGWVHNLEHGWVVLLYRCPSGVIGQGDCISQDDYNQMQQWYAQAPTPAPSEGCNKEVLVARFDSMNTQFAEVAWGRAYLFDQFNLDNALTFAQQWMDKFEPEQSLC